MNEEELKISEVYTIRGWTSEGIPTSKTLEGMGLSDVGDDLVRRKVVGE
ncbi:MAG TPA: aldehyde ferredoxin oxidoreductase C-terminal domain-containing protein [Thermodesulfobacteriota bacterium]|mgnify:CR=1 FL=1|nr:aldehyde ferredoxin oxidoreductase C-terminal domain-containing protein [Thermodesulfobacteriota bacterium]